MNDLKLIVAKNITELRKQHGMTQLQLAEKLNYSDKAVSKWERGESVPDVAVLVEIAELFSVTLDYLVKDEHTEADTKPQSEEERKLKEATQRVIVKNRKAITGISIQAVWLLAIMVFVPIAIFLPDSGSKWLCFIYAIPASSIVWLVFNSVWFNRRRNYLIISILMWSLLAAVHITALFFGASIHYIYLLGLPGELIIILCSVITKKPTK